MLQKIHTIIHSRTWIFYFLFSCIDR